MMNHHVRLDVICEEIDRIERVKPLLRDLGDVVDQDRWPAILYTHRDALAGQGVPA